MSFLTGNLVQLDRPWEKDVVLQVNVLAQVTLQPERLRSRVVLTTEVVEGDVLVPDSLAAAMQGVHTAGLLPDPLSGDEARLRTE